MYLFPTSNICLWNWRREMPGEEARVSNICPCSLSSVAGVCGLLVAWGLIRVQHLSTKKYIQCYFPVTPTYSRLGTVFSSANGGYLLTTYSCGVKILSAVRSGLFYCSLYYCQSFSCTMCTGLAVWLDFQKLFPSCMLLNKLGLFDRVMQASLVWVLTS